MYSAAREIYMYNMSRVPFPILSNYLPRMITECNCSVNYCTLCGRIKGAASAVSVIQHGLRGGARNIARHVITVTVLAFPYTRNKVGKMQSTINQLKHGRDVLYVQ